MSAVKKDAWIVGFGHGHIKQNRSGWCVSMRPARMQQGPSKKDPGGRRTEQKRPELENVPPWRCGCTHGLHGTRNRNLRMPDSHPERGQAKKVWAGLLGVTSHTRSLCL